MTHRSKDMAASESFLIGAVVDVGLDGFRVSKKKEVFEDPGYSNKLKIFTFSNTDSWFRIQMEELWK